MTAGRHVGEHYCGLCGRTGGLFALPEIRKHFAAVHPKRAWFVR